MKIHTKLAAILVTIVLLLTACGRTNHKKTDKVSLDSTSTEEFIEQQQTSYYGPLVDTILHHSKIKFKQIQKDNITFYYELDPFFDQHIHELVHEAIVSRNHCISLLGNKKASYNVKIIYFNDREKLRPFIKMAPKGLALPDAYTLLIATNDSTRAYHTHELMHIVSIHQFGGYALEPASWIQEGIAVSADNPCLGYPIHAIAANLLYTKKLAPLDTLFYQFRTLPDIEGYLQAGSVVQFFLKKYGLAKFEALWKQGVNNLEPIIHQSKTDFEKEYHRFLRKTYPQPPEINWALLNEKGCG